MEPLALMATLTQLLTAAEKVSVAIRRAAEEQRELTADELREASSAARGAIDELDAAIEDAEG